MTVDSLKLLETIERLEAVAAGRSGPEAEAFRAKAESLRRQLAEATAQQAMPPPNYADLSPAEQAALEIQMAQSLQEWEDAERAIFEWEHRLAEEKRHASRRRHPGRG